MPESARVIKHKNSDIQVVKQSWELSGLSRGSRSDLLNRDNKQPRIEGITVRSIRNSTQSKISMTAIGEMKVDSIDSQAKQEISAVVTVM